MKRIFYTLFLLLSSFSSLPTYVAQKEELKTTSKKRKEGDRKAKMTRIRDVLAPIIIGFSLLVGVFLIAQGTGAFSKQSPPLDLEPPAKDPVFPFMGKPSKKDKKKLKAKLHLELLEKKKENTEEKKRRKRREGVEEAVLNFWESYKDALLFTNNEHFENLNGLMIPGEPSFLLIEDFINQEGKKSPLFPLLKNLDGEGELLLLPAKAQGFIALCFMAKELLGWTKEDLLEELSEEGQLKIPVSVFDIKNKREAYNLFLKLWLKNLKAKIDDPIPTTSKSTKLLLSWSELLLSSLQELIEEQNKKIKEQEQEKTELTEKKDSELDLKEEKKYKNLINKKEEEIKTNREKLEALKVKSNDYTNNRHASFREAIKEKIADYEQHDELLSYMEELLDKELPYYTTRQKNCTVCHEDLYYHEEEEKEKNNIYVHTKNREIAHKSCLEKEKGLDLSAYTLKKIKSTRKKEAYWVCRFQNCGTKNFVSKSLCTKCGKSLKDACSYELLQLARKFETIQFRETLPQENWLPKVKPLNPNPVDLILNPGLVKEQQKYEEKLKKLQEELDKNSKKVETNQTHLAENLLIDKQIKKKIAKIFKKTDLFFFEKILPAQKKFIQENSPKNSEVSTMLEAFEKKTEKEQRELKKEGERIIEKATEEGLSKIEELKKVVTAIRGLHEQNRKVEKNFEEVLELIQRSDLQKKKDLLNIFETFLQKSSDTGNNKISTQTLEQIKKNIDILFDGKESWEKLLKEGTDRKSIPVNLNRKAHLRFHLFLAIYYEKKKWALAYKELPF